MTYQEQLELWVAGQPVCQDQCCPDFSCCKPELLQPVEVRKAFLEASEPERMSFLGTFLVAAMALANSLRDDPKTTIDVRIVGRPKPS